MDARSLLPALALGLALSACLEFDDREGLEGFCFDWASERYAPCDGGQPADGSSDAEITDVMPEPADAMSVDLGMADAGHGADANDLDSGVPVDAGVEPDVGFPDSGIPPDTGVEPDSGVVPDAGFVDTGVPPDLGFPDSGIVPDAGFPDSGVPPDAGFPDSGIVPDAGFPQAATITFTGPGNGRLTTDQLSAGGALRSYSCDYEGSTQSLICYELIGGNFAVYSMGSGAPQSLYIEFNETRLQLTGQGRAGGTFTSFTGDCTPPVIGNVCWLDYMPPIGSRRAATVRFD